MRIEMDIEKLIAVTTGKIPHDYRGFCPDKLQPDSRDDECPACKILTEAAAEHDAMEHRLREAEGHVHALIDEAVEAEREACAKVCEQQIRRAGDEMTFYTAVGQCAAAIRTRSIQPARGEG